MKLKRHPDFRNWAALARAAGSGAVLVISFAPLAAQTIRPRGERPQVPTALRTLAVREATFSSSVARATAIYRKEAGSQTFVLESSEGESKLEWKVGGETRPLPEELKPAAGKTEKRIKLIPHEGKLFLKIEAFARTEPQEKDPEIRFSGTYEAAVVDGSWEAYLGGGEITLRITPGDHERYLADMKKAIFSDTFLARQTDAYRKQLLALLEARAANPAGSSPGELERIRQTLVVVKAHPEALAVGVSSSFEEDPEILVIKGETLHSTIGRQASALRFDVRLPVVAPQSQGR